MSINGLQQSPATGAAEAERWKGADVIMSRGIGPWLSLLAVVSCLMAPTSGCYFSASEEDQPVELRCYPFEALAYSDSVAIVNTAHAGGELRVRIVGNLGCCSSLLRVESQSRGDTVLLRPIGDGLNCPLSPCIDGFQSFVDTVGVPAEHSGPIWVRVEVRRGRLVDSTVVLPAGARVS